MFPDYNIDIKCKYCGHISRSLSCVCKAEKLLCQCWKIHLWVKWTHI